MLLYTVGETLKPDQEAHKRRNAQLSLNVDSGSRSVLGVVEDFPT